MSDKITKVVYTRAPKAADYSYTKTLEEFECGGPVYAGKWRKVEVCEDEYRVRYQCARYASFLRGFAVTEDPRMVEGTYEGLPSFP